MGGTLGFCTICQLEKCPLNKPDLYASTHRPTSSTRVAQCEGGLLHCADVQGCVATTHEGLYEGLDWLRAQFASRDVKNVVTKPVKESVVSPLSRIQNALKNYLWPPATEVS